MTTQTDPQTKNKDSYESTQNQALSQENWNTITIAPGRYFNPEAVTGFEIKQGPKGNPLHGSMENEFEDQLQNTFKLTNQAQPEIELKRAHFQMPVINPNALPDENDYLLLETPKSLSSTSVTLAWIKQDKLKQVNIGYHYQGSQLEVLRERLAKGKNFRGLVGNLGYFMTKELNAGNHIWSHQKRFSNPEHQLPEILAYLGFYYYADHQGNIETAGFQSAHTAGIGVKHDGKIEVIPKLRCHAYDVKISQQLLRIEHINPTYRELNTLDVALFDVNMPFSHTGDLVEFSPMLETQNRVNIFVSNQGNGARAYEEVVKIWHEQCPLPSFGVIISIKAEVYKEIFPQEITIKTPVFVTPYSHDVNFKEYSQILSGLVPAVINGKTIIPTGKNTKAKQAEQAFDKVANTDAPLSRTGKETNNFDAQIREPSGLFLQTQNYVGYLLFDGRHEMSVGANIVDVTNLIKRLSKPDLNFFDGESIQNAIFVDGGSAMKTYAVDVNQGQVDMKILNRVAAGGRNAPGNDPQGLNLYSTVIMEL